MELNVLRKFNGVRCRNYCKYLENLISAFMLPVGLFLTLSENSIVGYDFVLNFNSVFFCCCFVFNK